MKKYFLLLCLGICPLDAIPFKQIFCCYSARHNKQEIERIFTENKKHIDERMKWWIEKLQARNNLSKNKEKKQDQVIFDAHNSIQGHFSNDFFFVNRTVETLQLIINYADKKTLPDDYKELMTELTDYQDELVNIAKKLNISDQSPPKGKLIVVCEKIANFLGVACGIRFEITDHDEINIYKKEKIEQPTEIELKEIK